MVVMVVLGCVQPLQAQECFMPVVEVQGVRINMFSMVG